MALLLLILFIPFVLISVLAIFGSFFVIPEKFIKDVANNPYY